MTIQKLISKSDFDGVVNLSEHCKEGDEILNQYIVERQNLDLIGLLGNCFYNEVLENVADANYADLINGSTYTVDGKVKTHFGLKRVLIHFVTGAYMYRGGMVDTPFSVVQKMSQDSVPVPIQELRNLRDEHRRMGSKYWAMTFDYLCSVKKEDDTRFPCFDDCDCPKECEGCSSNNCVTCNQRRADDTRSVRIKVIKR